ncbi:MAG: tRNA pseudouridine(54/55) synthase Pus10 [Candidatus Diapherotrites archaeon]|nr:tRNA pseudouridine(54/55) synthase Pus10 [Candidatus Diapherotrites archaeon]
MPRCLKSRKYHSFAEISPPSKGSKSFSFDSYPIQELLKTIQILAFGKDFQAFSVTVSWPKKVSLTDAAIAHLRRTVQCGLVKEAEQKLGKKADFRSFEAEFLIDFNKNRAFLRLSPLYIEGKYLKFSRKIANTSKPGFESVESLLSSIILPAFKSQFGILHGAGREDIDVLMLGSGRPFIIELLQPEIRNGNLKKLEKLEKEINSKFEGKIAVNSLKFVSKSEVALLKNTQHEKIYSALVSCSQKPDLKKLEILLNKKIEISQRTPLRVSKRRSDLVRKKEVELLEIKKIGDKKNDKKNFNFKLKLKTSHGTYVKEFISGDGGRTSPSVSSILDSKCACAQLDVLEIL